MKLKTERIADFPFWANTAKYVKLAKHGPFSALRMNHDATTPTQNEVGTHGGPMNERK